MDNQQRIANGFNRLLRSNATNAVIFTAQVVEVQDKTCTVKIGTLTTTDVRLCAVVNDNEASLIVKPKEGTQITVADLSNGQMRDLVVIKYDEIDTITINGGKLGGLTITPELVANLGKMTARINGIIDAIKNAPTVPQDGGSAFKAAIVTALNGLVDVENFSKIENERIKQ